MTSPAFTVSPSWRRTVITVPSTPAVTAALRPGRTRAGPATRRRHGTTKSMIRTAAAVIVQISLRRLGISRNLPVKLGIADRDGRLIDEDRKQIPLVLGECKRLFPEKCQDSELALVIVQ